MSAFCVESKAISEDEWKWMNNITIVRDHSKHRDMDWAFASIWISICPQIDNETLWKVRIRASCVNGNSTVCRLQISWWIVLWCCFTHSHCPTDFNLLHSGHSLKQIKEHARN